MLFRSIIEKSSKLAMVEASFDWSDVGSWKSIWEMAEKDAQGNAIKGEVKSVGSSDSLFHTDRRMVAIDVQDMVCVQHAGATLIAPQSSLHKLREVIGSMEKTAVDERGETTFRPWGSYRVIEATALTKIKEIRVAPGQKLSFQYHNHRSEHWIVLSGKGAAQIEDELIQLEAGSHVFIPLKARHRLINESDETLVLIEIQAGSYFGEDDIVRLDDIYGRANEAAN